MGGIFCCCICDKELKIEEVTSNIEFTEEEIKLILNIAKCKDELLSEGKTIKQNITIERERLIIPLEITERENIDMIEMLIVINKTYELLEYKRDCKRYKRATKEIQKAIDVRVLHEKIIIKL